MAKESPHQTHYTRQIYRLLAKVYGRSALKDSLLDHAIDYFEHEESSPSDEKLSTKESQLEQMQRSQRHSSLLALSLTILELAEGDSFSENNRKSAQFLGTIQLLSPTEGKRVASNNEQCKSIYKAVLCLRLLDRLIIEGKVAEPYIKRYLKGISAEQYIDFAHYDKQGYECFYRFSKGTTYYGGVITRYWSLPS